MRRSILVALLLSMSTCKARNSTTAVKNEAGRTQQRLDPGPSIPERGRSLFDLVLHRDANPAGMDQVPYPFEKLDAYIGSVVHRDRDPNGEMKATSSVLIPVGRSIQRFAAEPDFFRFPRIVLSPTSWFDSSSGIPISLESKLFVAFAPLANQLEVISYNEELGRYEFQVVEYYAKGETPRLRYADRALCVSCHQNQGPIFSSEPWNDTNFNMDVATLIAGATGKETYHGIAVRQTEADTDSGANDSFSLNIRVDNASDIIAMNIVWTLVAPRADGDTIAYRAQLLRTMLLDSLGIETAGAQQIANVDGLISKVFPQEFPITDGIFATRFVLNGLSATPDGKQVMERIQSKEARFLFDGSAASQKVLAVLTSSIQKDLRSLPPVGQALGTARVTDSGVPEPIEVFDGAAFFGVFRSAFRTYGMDALRRTLNVDKSNGVKVVSEIVDAMEKRARVTQQGILVGDKPITLYGLLREVRDAANQPPPSVTWLDAQNLPAPIGPEVGAGLIRAQIQNDHLRRLFSACDSCHRVSREGVPAFLAGETEESIIGAILKYKSSILDRMRRRDDSAMPPPGTNEAVMLERFSVERQDLIRWVEGLSL